MHQTHVLSTLVVALVLVGCGSSIRPRLGRGPEPSDFPQGGPRPTRDLDPPGDAVPVIEKVCRSQAPRSGWIVTSYIQGAPNCPISTDSSNAYNGAIIERFGSKPVGSTIVVCADQAIPRLWVREYAQEAGTACPGARVRDGEPTAMVIRRVSEPGSR